MRPDGHGRRRRAAAVVAFVVTGALGAPAVAFAQPSRFASPGAGPRAASLPHGLGALSPPIRLVPATATGRVHAAGAASAPPASVDLTQWTVATGNQGQVGSCVSWAIDYSLLGWYQKRAGAPSSPLAPMYTYSQLTSGHNVGTDPDQTLALIKAHGVDTQADYTQGNYDFTDQPTPAETANAAHFKITGYESLFDGGNQGPAGQTALEQALAAGKPVAVTIPVYNNFFAVGPTNSYYNAVSGPLEGYHEVSAFGYSAKGLVIENQWGSAWGNNGFSTLSWAFVNQYVVEALTIDGLTSASAPSVRVVSPASGPTAGGQTTTISGTGFAGTASVLFGTRAAPRISVNAAGTILTVVTPAENAGSLGITVVSGYDSPSSAAARYTFVAKPVVSGHR